MGLLNLQRDIRSSIRKASISERSEDFIVFGDASHHGLGALQRNKVIDSSRRMVILKYQILKRGFFECFGSKQFGLKSNFSLLLVILSQELLS